jgi:hypothetical protein
MIARENTPNGVLPLTVGLAVWVFEKVSPANTTRNSMSTLFQIPIVSPPGVAKNNQAGTVPAKGAIGFILQKEVKAKQCLLLCYRHAGS